MSTPGTNSALAYTSVASAENPWPGLLSFREADQRWFQGRSEETAELLQHVKRERVTVVFALSGLGKSSLLQAGLFPAMRKEDIFPIPIRLDHAPNGTNLRSQVFDAIAQAGASAAVVVPQAREGETLWEYFHHLQTEFWNNQQRRVLPLLVFDQFEEIFTLGGVADRAGASAAFLDELADLAEDAVPPSTVRTWALNPGMEDDYSQDGEYKLLISLREDFLPELSDQRRRISGVPQKRYRLRQMNGEGALLAVSHEKDHLVDEAVATQIVRYIATGEHAVGRRGAPLKELVVEPALLSVVCAELNDRRRQRGERMISADLLEGSHEEILNNFYDRCFVGTAPSIRAFVEEQFITVGGSRKPVPMDDALKGIPAETIEQLGNRRLLRKEFLPNGDIRLELTHDLLTGVVRTSRDRRRSSEAEARLRLEAEETRAKLRRNTRLVMGFAGIAVLAVIAAVFAFRQTVLANDHLVQANSEKKIADEKTREALQSQKYAEQKSQEALDNLQKANAETARADVSAKDALTQAGLKEEERLKAVESAAREAAARRQSEKDNVLAQKAAEQETIARKDAEQKTQDAIRAGAAETVALKQAVEAKRISDRESAVGMIDNAATKISSGNHALALGEIARALTLDPDSLAARTLAFDQLLRGSAAGLAKTGTEQFVHPALSHPAGVLFAAFSPDGRQIVTSSSDNVIRLWDWTSGRPLAEFRGHTDPVTMVAFSPNGQRLVSSSADQTARVWDVAKRGQIAELRHPKAVYSAVFSADGRRIVTASLDRTAQIWDAETGKKIGDPLQHPMTVNYASFSPNGQRVITACSDGKARIWDLAGGRPPLNLSHNGEVKSAVFSPDGRHVVTASADHTARLWDATSGTPFGVAMQHGGVVYFATYSPDGKRIATASKDTTARVWDAQTGRAMTAPLQHKDAVLGAAFSQDNRKLVTASIDKTAKVWEVGYTFDRTDDIVKLLEALSGLDAGTDALPVLPAADKNRLMSEVTAASNQPGSTATFTKWFLAHRQQ